MGEEERRLQFDNLFKDVAGVLVDKCVNAESGRPYTLALIERALRDVHFNLDPKRSAKQQALEVGPCLLLVLLFAPRASPLLAAACFSRLGIARLLWFACDLHVVCMFLWFAFCGLHVIPPSAVGLHC